MPPLSPEALRATVDAYLAERHALSLATIGPGGPWAASLYFVHDETFRLYFVSAPHTRHIQQLGDEARVAATINEDYADWREIRGVQLAGTCALLQDEVARQAALARYVAKFAFLQQILARPDHPDRKLGELLLAAGVYCISPTRLLYLDNRRGFSQRQALIGE